MGQATEISLDRIPWGQELVYIRYGGGMREEIAFCLTLGVVQVMRVGPNDWTVHWIPDNAPLTRYLIGKSVSGFADHVLTAVMGGYGVQDT